MRKIKVFLADDHPIVRKGLMSLLVEQTDIVVVGEAENGREALTKIEQLQPDVVVMDITMPLLNGLEATRQIKRRWPSIHVVMLTIHTTEEYIFQILQAGASGYVVKQAAPSELVMAIGAAYDGETFLSPSISQTVIREYIAHAQSASCENTADVLTEREYEICQLLVEGYSSREIADMLVISIKTVETHRGNLLRKLDIDNLADLTKYAIRKGITPLD
ncbi:MAG: response regulator transcription factor [Ardenticatenaceae bacterium]|nr:response regulator transcription factor [Ardenticatenaceae bacterium]